MNINTPRSTSYIEVSKSALKNNIEFIKKNILNKDCLLSCVVKGNAYGHGIDVIVPLLQSENKIKHFSVFSVYDALKVQSSLIKPATILVMGHIPERYLTWVLKNKIHFYISDTSNLIKLAYVVKKYNLKAHIHLEVETGMNRTGILLKNFKKCLEILGENKKNISVEGLCTHYAGAESIVNHSRVKQQIVKFKKFQKIVEVSNLKVKSFHTACSAACLRFPQTQMDMARIGILQYGFWPNQETFIYTLENKKLASNPLSRILTWKSEVMSIKAVSSGEFIGYGEAYLANEDKLIAVIPVGYSDGYSRSLSNQARVLINGEFASVAGIVNMNAISVDVTHIKNVEVGSEVVLIGKQGEREISVSSFSDFTDQLNYEVLARLPSTIPRYLVK